MNEKIKSPSSQGSSGGSASASGPIGSGGNGSSTAVSSAQQPGLPTPSNGSDQQSNPHAYGPPVTDSNISHYHIHQSPHPQHITHQPPGMSQTAGEQSNKEEYNQNPLTGPPPPPSGHHPYGRFHHGDPNIDPYRYGHTMQQSPSGGKPQPQAVVQSGPGGSLSSPNRPPQQRYIPGQPPQGPTPTLNSLLQSSHPPPPPQHRYSNNFDPQQQVGQQAVGPQGPHIPPPPHQVYATQQGGWAPPPRPYSPQLGPSQAYRTPPPGSSSRGQSPYPPAHGQNSGSYSSSSQQPAGPPPQSSNQGTVTSQYSPYPQRYPTPPNVGPNHRNPFSTHQYPDPNRPWPGGSSPAPSPGPGSHPHPPASPHQPQHAGPPPSSSPGHAPSPSPQPSQASPSPQQELSGQNSNDSSSGGGHSNMPGGPPGTPNPQQVMRPTPSPTSSSGSRSMSPAVAQNHPSSRPSSNQSSSGSIQQGSAGPPAPQHILQNSSAQQQPHTAGGPGGIMAPSAATTNAQQAPPVPVSAQQQQQQPPPPPPPSANQSVANTGPPPPQNAGMSSYLPPSHMHGNYKIGVPGSNAGTNAQGYPNQQQPQQYSQGSYPPRPQYPPSSYTSNQAPPSQPMVTSGIPPSGSQQFSGRSMPNHSGSNPHSQYPYQNWAPPSGSPGIAPSGGSSVGNHIQGKATPPPIGIPPQQASGSPRPLNYLKQHLQHKGGYNNNAAQPQGYGNGPGLHHTIPMGPPHHMGPPTSMGPPVSTPPQAIGTGVAPNEGGNPIEHISQDNGISSSSSSTASGSHPVTSVITTGPDGTPMDEVSQQSTLSNASAASAEDPQCTTPKARKSDPYNQAHLAPPSTSPSNHPGHQNAANEDYDMNSPPNWTRTPASPVFNSHVPSQETFRSSTKKSDSLCKLYEMDDNPERRGWLDKLRAFMEERRTPITACPTISKQPLDLYRLYIYVKERGGFVEVTKSKTWKDIAGLLGIGASSSAAYTLRKHYTKNLLAFECHFDRGDIDPLPIIQQVEAGTKKKTTKATSVPSPAGSSNSQDSFPAPGAPTNAGMEGYPGYPTGYPTVPQPEYASGGQIQRPPSQSNAQTPHSGAYPGQNTSYGQYGTNDQYNSTGSTGQFGQNQGQFAPQTRNLYPYGPEAETSPAGSNQYGPYGTRHYNPPPSAASPGSNAAGPNVTPTNNTAGVITPTGSYSPGTHAQSDYYRPADQNAQPRRHPDFVKDSQPYPGYNARPQLYAGWQTGSNQYRGQYPSAPSPQGWVSAPPRSAAPQGGPLGPPTQQTSSPVPWEQHRYPPQQAPPPQQPSYQQQNQPQPPPQWAQMNNSPSVQSGPPGSPIRAPSGQQQQRMPTGGGPGLLSTQPSGGAAPNQNLPSGMPKIQFSMPPPQSGSGTSPGMQAGGMQLGQNMVGPPKPTGGTVPQTGVPVQQAGYQSGAQLAKKDIIFPPDSVEAVTPILYRRKRLTKADICPVDPWRLFMAMRSGLLTECTWALDVLNILLFDDTTVQYFGLTHLPGLLTLLLEHFQKNLSDMFNDKDDVDDIRNSHYMPSVGGFRHKHYDSKGIKLRTTRFSKIDYDEDGGDINIDLGQVRVNPKPEERVVLLAHSPNYTFISRKGVPVRIHPAEGDIFISDEKKSWDIDTEKLLDEMLPLENNPWTYGISDRDLHDGIIDVFKSEIIDIPYARHIKVRSRKIENSESLRKSVSNGNGNGNPNASTNNDNGEVTSDSLSETSNKKRRTLYNSKNTVKTTETCDVKKVEETNDEGKFVQPDFKKETINDINNAPSQEMTIANSQPSLASPAPPTTVAMSTSASASLSDSDCRAIDMEIETPQKVSKAKGSTISNGFDPKLTARDTSLVLKRRRDSTYEDECYTRDEASLYLVNESQDSLARRCICISNIFRNLTFVPGNETILAKSSRFLAILGRLLLLNHEHLQRTPKTRNYDREEDTDFSDSCSSLQGESEWWWDYLISIRENMLVALANIAGHLELSRYEEIIARPLIDGLLHWAVCPSAHSQDPFPTCGINSSLSPQRLALEALCKLCVTDANVDLVIATPPHSRLEKLCAVLTRHLCRNEDQVLREFSVNLLHYLAAADSAMARTVALQAPCISYLVAFIEQAEQTALGVANQHGINYLRENPDSMGTSLDMLRRAAGTLLHLAKHPDNRSLFMQQEQRLLGLVMSHILDQQVALIISRVLFQVSRGPPPLQSMEYRLLHRQQQQQQRQQQQLQKDSNQSAKSTKMLVETKSEIKSENTMQLQKKLTCSTVVTDDNSNGSSQLPPPINFNDVSNSSTNSNSCGTASSNVSSNLSSSGGGGGGNIKSFSNNIVTNQDTSDSALQENSLSSNNKHSTTATTNVENASYNSSSSSGSASVSIANDSNLNSGTMNNNNNNNNNNNGINTSLTANTSSNNTPPPPTTTAAVA